MVNITNKEKKVLLIVLIAVIFLSVLLAILVLFISAKSFDVNPFEKKLAIIPIKEPIFMTGDGFSTNFGALEIVEKIGQAADDPSVAGIFFDIDSPGGEPVATHQIVEKIRESKKPTVAYIGATGASAAYWIASSTDYVVADPFSVTASIGAISIFPNIKDLLEEHGVEVKIIKSGNLKAVPNIFEKFDAEQEALIKQFVDEAFEQFKSDILFFREGKIDQAEFEKITDGRILSGKQAFELNLVDELLTREKAIKMAAELSGIKGEPSVKEFGPSKISFFDLFAASGKAFASGFKSYLDLQSTFSIRT